MAGAVMLGAFAFGGCAAIKAAKRVASNVEGNKAAVDAFTSKLSTGAATSFEATYATSGTAPATIVYAVKPPTGVSFTDTPDGTGGGDHIHLILNSSGEYSCTPSDTSGGHPTCQRLGTTSAAAQNAIFTFYTPSHWVGFLRDFSVAAGVAGDTVTSSTMSVNGFNLHCVDFRTPGTTGISTICSTAQGILGYVKVANDSTSFAIRSYSSSPDPSLFALPPGATVTTQPTGTNQ
jgi:hypothetical protein